MSGQAGIQWRCGREITIRALNAIAARPCPHCDCAIDHPVHAVVAALLADDLDAAFDLGLLDAAPCPHCSADCNARLVLARDERLRALAARERYRARDARLARRAAERDARRAPVATVQATSALPPTAAAALARAKARAAARKAR